MLVGASTAPGLQDRALKPETAYKYTVAAVNGARAVGPRSATARATTPPNPVPALSVTLAVTAFSPADGLEMNHPPSSATCTGGSGRYNWTIDWDGGDYVEQVSAGLIAQNGEATLSHPGLAEGAHTFGCPAPRATGGRAERPRRRSRSAPGRSWRSWCPSSNAKWVGDDLFALEGATHSLRLRVAEGQYSGARYDYRIAWATARPISLSPAPRSRR